MPKSQSLFVKLDPANNVVVAAQPMGLGSKAEGIDVVDQIPSGHKIATAAIDTGAAIKKYGQVIGYARELIRPGQHVHAHNLI